MMIIWPKNIFWEFPPLLMNPDSKVHGANMGPTWVLASPGGPHVGPMNLVIRVCKPVFLVRAFLLNVPHLTLAGGQSHGLLRLVVRLVVAIYISHAFSRRFPRLIVRSIVDLNCRSCGYLRLVLRLIFFKSNTNDRGISRATIPKWSQLTTLFSGHRKLWRLVFPRWNCQQLYDYKIIRFSVTVALVNRHDAR